MNMTADKKGRLPGLEWFEPGSEYQVSCDDLERIVLEKLAPFRPQQVSVSIVKYGGHPCFKTSVPVPEAAMAAAVREHHEG